METSSSQRVQSPSKGIQHKRTYQACIPCRQRKVRCDLGKVDEPHEPPCLRCRRESKECFFSSTRAKRRSEDGQGTSDSLASRSSRRKTPVQVQQQNLLQPTLFTTAPANGDNRQRHDYADHVVASDELKDETAAALFQTPINTPEDALQLLLKASDLELQNTLHQGNPQPTQDAKSRKGSETYQFARGPPIESVGVQGQSAIENPETPTGGLNNGSNTEVSPETLGIWSRLRFVRAGWLTAREAVAYVNHFYDFLSPLTPISIPNFRSPSLYETHLNEEPILVVTILTIASRYKILEGPGGQTRSFIIHERLWNHLQNLITRMFWGQEQFGGGLSGAGSRSGIQKEGLRSLGTVESLLLLSDFHPRSMHFPPGDDVDEIFASSDGDMAIDEAQGRISVDNSTFAGWIEPALRSDRMCWSLVGTAYILAYELGIFGNYADGIRTLDGDIKCRSGHFDNRQRTNRIERLLYIYVTQTSGRLGFPSVFHHKFIEEMDLSNIEQALTPGNRSLSQDPIDVVQQSWLELTSIMKTCNARLFGSKERTTELIRSGEYIGHLRNLQPILTSWKKNFQSLDVPKSSRIILLIEFEYGRIYINSLGLQAVLDHWTANGGQDYDPQNPTAPASTSLTSSYKQNELYITEVIDASRSLLQHIVTGLPPDNDLKHGPVRTHMRILSGAMFLLKTFALGAKKDEVEISLNLLRKTVDALRTNVVDDVHLCLRVADLLEGLTSSISNKLVRLPARRINNPHVMAAQQNLPANPRELTMDGARDNFAYSYLPDRSGTVQDTVGGICGERTDTRESGFSIMPPRDNAYDFPYNTNYNAGTPNSAAGSYDPQQALPSSTSSFSDEWLTLDLNALLPETMNGEVGTSWADPHADWFANFGPGISENLEVLGKLANEQYRGGEGFDGGGGMGSSGF